MIRLGRRAPRRSFVAGRVGHAAVALAALASGVALTPVRADHAPAWVFEASRTSAGVIEVTTDAYQFVPNDVHVIGGSKFVGVLVEPLDTRTAVGLLLRVAGKPSTFVAVSAQMPRGRYRVTVLTDAPARVELPNYFASGDDQVVALKPAPKTSVAFGSAEASPLSPTIDLRLPGAVPARTRAVLAASTRDSTQVGTASLCAAPAGIQCPANSDVRAWNSKSHYASSEPIARDAVLSIQGARVGSSPVVFAAVARP